MEFVGIKLIIYWIFFGLMSVLPMILAIVTQKKADKEENKRGRGK